MPKIILDVEWSLPDGTPQASPSVADVAREIQFLLLDEGSKWDPENPEDYWPPTRLGGYIKVTRCDVTIPEGE